MKQTTVDMMEKANVCEISSADYSSAKRQRTGLSEFLNKADSSSDTVKHNTASKSRQSCSAELENYLDSETSSCDPVQFWRENQSRFPRLAVIAKQTLPAPESTAVSERLFSIAGYILSQCRTRITDDDFQNQLFANVNSDLPEVPGKKLRLEK